MSAETPPARQIEPIRILEGSAWRRVPLVAGLAGIVALAVAAVIGRGSGAFFAAYLVAYCTFLGLALGGLFFVIAQFAGRAGWSVAVRRLAEHAMATLPLFALLFAPIAIGADHLYPWTDAGAMATDQRLQAKAAYLNLPAFVLRAAVYLAIWTVIGWWFYRRSLQQDVTGDPELTRRLQRAAGPALALYGLSVSFAAIDWIMSLDPHWHSTIIGIYYFAGCAVGFFALMSVLCVLLRRGGPLAEIITVEHLHDLGRYLFAFVVFWAYIAFSQYLLQWYANIPEETAWYVRRGDGWLDASISLVVGHFVAPLLLLLPRGAKRRPGSLLLCGSWLLAMHYLDRYWLIMPGLRPAGPAPAAVDLLCLLGIGGLFVAVFARQLCRHSLVPVSDPRLAESLSHDGR